MYFPWHGNYLNYAFLLFLVIYLVIMNFRSDFHPFISHYLKHVFNFLLDFYSCVNLR